MEGRRLRVRFRADVQAPLFISKYFAKKPFLDPLHMISYARMDSIHIRKLYHDRTRDILLSWHGNGPAAYILTERDGDVGAL